MFRRNYGKEDIDYYLKNEKDALYVSGFVIEGMMSNYINKINESIFIVELLKRVSNVL